MLMRFASLLVETVPRHAAFDSRRPPPAFRDLKATLRDTALPDLERLKASLTLRAALADVEGGVGGDEAPAPREAGGGTRADALADVDGVDWGAAAAAAAAAVAASAPPPPPPARLPSFSTAELPPPSAASMARHTLLAAPAAAVTLDRPPSAGRVEYGSVTPSAAPPPPPPPASSLMDAPLAPLPPGVTAADLAAASAPRPELALGPQEVGVTTLPRPSGPPPPPGARCVHPPPLDPAPPALGADLPGSAPAGRGGLREVHVSAALLDAFLRVAAANTRSGVETCGILAGNLGGPAGPAAFCVTTLIIPKQKGTSDTVTTLAEENVFAAQDSRGLFPLGWVHTHPTQSCFLSSVDVHTQCGYQTMLDEAVAVVCAPRDAGRRCGIFRVSTPGGLRLLQRCEARGFHPHPPTDTGQPLYELCGHVYLNGRLGHEVLDLR